VVSTDPATFAHTDPGVPESTWRTRAEWQSLRALQLPDRVRRVVVVAAHPDDETLGAAGLLAIAHRAGLAVEVVLLTDGEGSHPRSPSVSAEALGRRRVSEARAALGALSPRARLRTVGLADGGLAGHVDEVVDVLVDVVGEEGPHTLLVAPWRRDGHTDHDAAGRAAAVTARRTDATLWEYPVWLWHWCDPVDAPWADLWTLALPEQTVTDKVRAIALHRTQVEPLSRAPGDEVMLHADFVAHFARPYEAYLPSGPTADDALDRVHRDSPDPWGVRTRWYEQRKRAVTLAALPERRYGRALEVGGSVGALAEDLASRCDELVVLDESTEAVAAARSHLSPHEHAAVVRASVPEEWPDGWFDLVVVSEVGYFLGPARLRELAHRVDSCLTRGGTIVLCHWRHRAVGWPLDGDRVHEIWTSVSDLPVAVSHVEADFRLDVLTASTRHRAGAS
jgi:LmbE family N-acetylglucosaminyl deacetylase